MEENDKSLEENKEEEGKRDKKDRREKRPSKTDKNSRNSEESVDEVILLYKPIGLTPLQAITQFKKEKGYLGQLDFVFLEI